MGRRNVRWAILACVSLLTVGPRSTFAAVVISGQGTVRGPIAKAKALEQTAYDHGDPSHLEQYLLELINRARADPSGEIDLLLNSGDTYIESALEAYGIRPDELREAFSGYDPQPPLALNAALAESAWFHSRDMADHDFQGHVGSAGSDLRQRLEDVGYAFIRAGENVYAYAHSMIHAQAAFLIDWGEENEGILGHRKNLLGLSEQTDFREIGLGVVSENSPSTAVGPWVITQDFGTGNEHTVFITGVVYRDDNGNDFYDSGEGLGQVAIRPARGDYYAVTSDSGGYAIPVPVGSGEYQVAMSALGLPRRSAVVTVTRANIKLDFVLGDSAYARLDGTVVDTSGAPLEGVAVRIEPIGITATTDAAGGFFFTDLPASNYKLIAALENYTFEPNDVIIALSSGQRAAIRLIGTLKQEEPLPPADGQTEPSDGSEDTADSAAGPWCSLAMIVVLSAIIVAAAILED